MNSGNKPLFKSYLEEIEDGNYSEQGLPSDIFQEQCKDKEREPKNDGKEQQPKQKSKYPKVKKIIKGKIKPKKSMKMGLETIKDSEMLLHLFKQHSSLRTNKNQTLLWLNRISQKLCLPFNYIELKYQEYQQGLKGQDNEQQQIKNNNKNNNRNISEKRNQTGVYKKTQKFDHAIKAVLKEIPFACISDLKEEIYRKEGLHLRKETLIRRLKKIGYKYQKYSVKKVTKNDEDEKILRKMYVCALKEIRKRGENILYYGQCNFTLDEFKGNMWMKVNEKGEPEIRVDEKELLVMVIIVSKYKLQYSRIFHGFYSRIKFISAIQSWAAQTETDRNHSKNSVKNDRIKVQSLYCGKVHLAIESTAVHHAKVVARNQTKILQNLNQQTESICEIHDETRLILGKHGIGLIYIPSFSSQLNPAEVIFNTIKYNVRQSKPKTILDIKNAITKVISNKIDRQDIKFGFQDLQKFYDLAIEEQDFI